MTSYGQILLLVIPVFALMGLGVLARRINWLTEEADASLLKLVVNLLYPCLILDHVPANAALQVPANLAWAPLVGFGTMALGIGVCYYAGRLLGFTVGTGLRTFAFTAGIYNYSYVTIPLMTAIFGQDSLGVLFVHNVGAEAAIFTVGVLVLAGESWSAGWRRLVNAPVVTLVIAVALNLTGLGTHIPGVLLTVIHSLAVCAIPMGLVLCGATVAEHLLGRPADLFEARTSLGAVALRLGLLPVVFLVLAKYGPFPADLRHVVIVQAGMPAAFLPLVLVKYYGGHQLTAVRVVLATVAASILLLPWWLQTGLAWAGR
ncbi:MAG: AEC family transporter [Verrucomicrobia bacterium]|nr:AEC family transporter [Verrucomicrobiota bacterium]